ncbi:thioredoxin family protein [Marinilongibacter aquaticus]|uniref:thioredoxin family protein n=1 Tax=Marinilongibacter aquaticus TaxID=2975157 RepID=UPI0021BDA691|nr:thioredoxin family protein [Marinilongibacter aquaticus]UBM60878.1 thioredoxin family protein [Marinilongibacter aquaticus]
MIKKTYSSFALHCLSFALFFFALGCNSKGQTEVDTNKVTWQADFHEAQAKAKAESKLFFVECFSPTCSHCQAVEPFFSKEEVAKMYNSNFVNYKLDVTNADQVKFINERGIWLPSFPMFLFFDGEGKLVHQTGAEPNLTSILGNAETALDPEKRASSFPKRFADGESSLNFLSDLANYGRVTKDTLMTLKAAERLFEVYPKEKIGSAESWSLTKKAVNDIDNGFAKYWFNHMEKAQEYETEEGHPAGSAANILGGILQNSMFSSRGQNYDVAKIHLVKEYMEKIGVGQYADNNTWEMEAKALIRENRLPEALAIGQRTVDNFKNNPGAIVYITGVLSDHYPGVGFVGTGKKWLAQAFPAISQNNVKAEYYLQMAKLNKKAGETNDAKANAQQAVELGGGNPKFQAFLNGL